MVAAERPAPPRHPIALRWSRVRGYVSVTYGGETVEVAFRDCPPEWRDELTAGRGERKRG